MANHIIKKIFGRKDFSSTFPWRELCEELGLDPIAQEIEIAIVRDECRSN